MSLQQLKPKKKLKFNAESVFKPEASEDLELDSEHAQYKARHGQGGDRRA